MDVLDPETVRKQKSSVLWDYEALAEAIKRAAGNKKEVGLRIRFDEIMRYRKTDHENVREVLFRDVVMRAAKYAGFKVEQCFFKNKSVWMVIVRESALD